MHCLGRQVRAAVFQHLMNDGRFVRSAGQKKIAGSRIQYRKRTRDAVGLELFYPVGNDQPLSLLQPGAAGKKGSGVAVGTDAEQDQIKARELSRGKMEKLSQGLFVLLRSSIRVFFLAVNAKDIFRARWNLG